MSAYQLDHQWHKERERLANIEAMFDPFTIECIERLAIQQGWHCLEVGAGGGSMATWLCQRVGNQGHVVATDLQTQFLNVIEASNLEIRQHDITKDSLEENTFDLVYTRAVLEHLADRNRVLDRLIAALKPGGWLLIGAGDYSAFVATDVEATSAFERGQLAFFRVLQAGGFDPYYGRKIAKALRDKRLIDVQMRGFVSEWGGDRPGTLAWTYLFDRLSDKVLAANFLAQHEINEFLKLVNDPDFIGLTPVACCAWGQKPR